MPKWTQVNVAEWMPDQPPLNNPGAITAKNCIPAANAYRPLSASVTFSVATGTSNDDYIRGAISVRDNADTVRTFCGDAKDLYEISATGWDIVSVSAGAYSGTATPELWRFAEWGDTLIATNFNNTPQQLDLSGSTFGIMAGSPPRARYVATIRDFVAFANIHENSTAKPRTVRWSAFNNANDWTASVRTQSDSQELFEGGYITGIVAQSFGQGEIGVIFQERAITLMTYVGPPLIFRFDQVDTRRGTRIPNSIIRYAHQIYYIGEDDFYVFEGGQSRSLGAEKVVRHFYNTLDTNFIERITATVDAARKIIIWSYPSKSSTEEAHPDKLIIFHWITGRWTEAEVQAESLFTYLTPGKTLDELDSISTDLDALPYSLDSKLWKGGSMDMAAFDRNHRLYTFSGIPLDATIDMTEVRAGPGRLIEVTNLRPLIEGAGTTSIAQVGHRMSQDASPTWTTTATANASGEVNVRIHSRFARVRLKATGTWKHIQGVDMYISERGIR